MSNKYLLLGIALVFLVLSMNVLPVLAQDPNNEDENDEDIEIYGLELEKLLSLFNGLLASVLFIITFVAYSRDQRKRLLYVSIAFLLFAFRSFIIASELFVGEVVLLDPLATVLDFVILLTFFYGLLRK